MTRERALPESQARPRSGKIVAVTGAAGYVGGRLLAHLSTQPWIDRLIAFDLNPVPSDGRIISYRLDVRDSSLLRPILAEHGVTHFIHAAFVINRPPDWTELQMRVANVEGSRRAIETALAVGIRHVTFISSVAVYGYHDGHRHSKNNHNKHTTSTVQITENAPLRPTMAYGRYKVNVESILSELSKRYSQAQIAVVRATAIVGARGRQRAPLWALATAPMFLAVNGGHAQTQAIHEDDAAALIGAIIRQDAAGVFHAAPDDSASWLAIGKLTDRRIVFAPRGILRQIAKLSTILPRLNGLNAEIVDLLSTSLVVDNSLARTRLNWAPRYGTLAAFAEMFGQPMAQSVRTVDVTAKKV